VPVSGLRRLFFTLLVGGAATAAAAQSNVVAPPPASRADTVGPEQLRNFALPGTQQQAPQDEAPASSRTPTRPATTTTTLLPPPIRERPSTAAPRDTTAEQQRPATRPATTVTTPLPDAGDNGAPAASPAATPAPFPAPTTVTEVPPGATLPAPAPSFPSANTPEPASDGDDWLKYLLALLVAAGAGGAIAWWWARRGRTDEAEQGFGQLAFAGGPAADAPATAPMPRPGPTPTPAPAAAPEAPVRAPSVGIVSSRLRAWLELDLGLRVAAITDEELVLEVDIVLANSGSAAAREIAVEALLINAGPDQAKEVTTFFARPDADGFAPETVQPMAQMALSATLKMPRGAFTEYAVGGGKVVVPIVALNAGYKAGGTRGRTSAAFLVGRAGADADKLGPFPTDQGAKGFNRLALKRLPEQVRR